jgi:hypothetical protein
VRPRRRWPNLLLVALATASPAVSAEPPAPIAVPDVPYVAQSEALCGGAALAMVLRYWGASDVRAEDFAEALTPDGRGIATDALVRAAEARGVRAYAMAPDAVEAAGHLAKGRPLIALISVAPGRHHYVVVLAWANGRVLFHDPAVAPFRVMPEAEWLRAWNAAGRWTLLVLPGEAARPADTPPATPAEADACDGLVAPAVARARAGDLDAARRQLQAAAAWCPASSAPLRELAAIEFRREGWGAAQDLAERAVAVDPSDAFAWRLLATSRFLGGRRDAALEAWNHVGEPRVDLVAVEGLERTPFRAVADSTGVDTGVVLTPSLLRRAQRRVAALPALQASRVAYRPLPGGKARLEIGIVERTAWTPPRTVLLQSVGRAISEHAVAAEEQAVAKNGDTLRAVGYWHPKRLRGLLSASSAHAFGLPGLVTADALWDEQTYRLSSGGATLTRERRQRGALSVSDWWTPDTRARVTVAADAWRDRGTYASLATELEQRLLGDHLALGGAVAVWGPADAPFDTTALRAAARTSTAADAWLLRANVAYERASVDAPLALWPGAGTGAGRPALLRAHPLVDGGIIDGAAFGRALLSATAQAEGRAATLGLLRLRGVAFADLAALQEPTRATFVDLGVGLRVRPPGAAWSFRFDLATPSGRWAPHLSAGWQADWPN